MRLTRPIQSCFPGLVARVYPAEKLVNEAIGVATKIASMSLPVAIMAKEAVNAAFEGTLAEGVRLERRMFHSAFALVSHGVSASGRCSRTTSQYGLTSLFCEDYSMFFRVIVRTQS